MATFYCRPDTWDESIVHHVYYDNEYGNGSLPSADTVIDIGAHIGSFSALVAKRGAGRVLAFEPHLENARLAMRNTREFGSVVEVYPLGIWRSDENLLGCRSHGGWSPENGNNTGGGSLAERMRFPEQVAVIALDAVLQMLGRVRLMKID